MDGLSVAIPLLPFAYRIGAFLHAELPMADCSHVYPERALQGPIPRPLLYRFADGAGAPYVLHEPTPLVVESDRRFGGI